MMVYRSVTHTGLMFPKREVAIAAGLTACLTLGLPTPAAEAAERIRFRYGLYELMVTRAELEDFCRNGRG